MVRITILCDNVVGLRVGIGEHGFAALVENDGENLLFDTGRGTGIVPNAQTFGKDLRRVKKICISHGHGDHTGGLAQVLELTGEAEVCGHPEMFQERIADKKINETVIRRFIGIPHRREHLAFLGARFRLETGFREVADGIFATGEIPRETPFERGDPDLLVRRGEALVQDPILDDQSLIIRASKGLVVVFGCAHAGMINTLHYARRQTGEERIRAVLGGTHLGFLPPEQFEASVEELRMMHPKTVAVSHCTGMKPAARLMQVFEDRFTFAHVGSTFRFD